MSLISLYIIIQSGVKGLYVNTRGRLHREVFSCSSTNLSKNHISNGIVLWNKWECKLVDIEAIFLEGKLTNSTYIDLPPGLVELGFITREDYINTYIELNGGCMGMLTLH